jgi:hypothetical protein
MSARPPTPEGYDVHLSNNPTIEALHKAGFVTLHWKEHGRIVTVRAVEVKQKGRRHEASTSYHCRHVA